MAHPQDGILEFRFVGFCGGRKTREPREARTRTKQQQTQPTCDTRSGNRTWTTVVGGEHSHHCTVLAPQIINYGSITIILLYFVFFFSREKKADSTKTAQHLVAAVDCDDMSLVSYNSVRDCNPLSTPNTAPPSVYNQLGLLPESTGEGLKVYP